MSTYSYFLGLYALESLLMVGAILGVGFVAGYLYAHITGN